MTSVEPTNFSPTSQIDKPLSSLFEVNFGGGRFLLATQFHDRVGPDLAKFGERCEEVLGKSTWVRNSSNHGPFNIETAIVLRTRGDEVNQCVALNEPSRDISVVQVTELMDSFVEATSGTSRFPKEGGGLHTVFREGGAIFSRLLTDQTSPFENFDSLFEAIKFLHCFLTHAVEAFVHRGIIIDAPWEAKQEIFAHTALAAMRHPEVARAANICEAVLEQLLHREDINSNLFSLQCGNYLHGYYQRDGGVFSPSGVHAERITKVYFSLFERTLRQTEEYHQLITRHAENLPGGGEEDTGTLDEWSVGGLADLSFRVVRAYPSGDPLRGLDETAQQLSWPLQVMNGSDEASNRFCEGLRGYLSRASQQASTLCADIVRATNAILQGSYVAGTESSEKVEALRQSDETCEQQPVHPITQFFLLALAHCEIEWPSIGPRLTRVWRERAVDLYNEQLSSSNSPGTQAFAASLHPIVQMTVGRD